MKGDNPPTLLSQRGVNKVDLKPEVKKVAEIEGREIHPGAKVECLSDQGVDPAMFDQTKAVPQKPTTHLAGKRKMDRPGIRGRSAFQSRLDSLFAVNTPGAMPRS